MSNSSSNCKKKNKSSPKNKIKKINMIINNDSNKDNINKIDNLNILNNSKNIITVDDNNLQQNINGIDLNNSLKQNINDIDLNNNLKSTINYKDLENRILSMNLNGFKNFFYIIKKNNENYTLKKEHILINLGKLKNETLNEILQFVNFYEQKENEMIKLESEINKYKKS
tara:strand:+ start:1289 stop:1798 length:510 start_codon:yes stop_codon:yes gene_type:complete